MTLGSFLKKYSCGDGIAYDIENAIQSVKDYVKHQPNKEKLGIGVFNN